MVKIKHPEKIVDVLNCPHLVAFKSVGSKLFTRRAPTNAKSGLPLKSGVISYNFYKWLYNWVFGFVSPL